MAFVTVIPVVCTFWCCTDLRERPVVAKLLARLFLVDKIATVDEFVNVL